VALNRIFSYLVPPAKSEEEPPNIRGTLVPLRGKLFLMLRNIFDRSETECDIPISFRPAADGTQSNEVHDEIVGFTRASDMAGGRALANRLAGNTTTKSGLGLLFLMVGSDGRRHKLVVSRFPAEEGILAEPRGQTLDIEFIERIFMKRATAYKAALYSGTSFHDHFWDGLAVDKQITERQDQLANYWIHGFLNSDFKTTPAAGTRRLALALRTALEQAPTPAVRQEILSAATLARGQAGRAISVQGFLAGLGLTEDAQNCVLDQLANESLATERFVLSREEFDRNLRLRSVELDTGVSVVGPADRFDDVVTREPVGNRDQEYRFTTSGRIVAERLKKT
jgi:hypothetical protein